MKMENFRFERGTVEVCGTSCSTLQTVAAQGFEPCFLGGVALWHRKYTHYKGECIYVHIKSPWNFLKKLCHGSTVRLKPLWRKGFSVA